MSVDYTSQLMSWIDVGETSSLGGFDYWNDVEQEEDKVFNVEKIGVVPLFNSLKEEQALWQISSLLNKEKLGDLSGTGLSLAAGVCGLESLLLEKYQGIKHLTCVEYSKHRIFELAPQVVSSKNVAPDRISFVYGSFYDIQLPDESVDFIVLSKSFHHAFEIDKLLEEMGRVLKKNGVVLIISEHYFGFFNPLVRLVKYYIKLILNYHGSRKGATLMPTWRRLYPVCNEKGDHHYSHRQYRKMFQKHKFNSNRLVLSSNGLQGYILRKIKD